MALPETSGFDDFGALPGKNGRASHTGPPLTVEEIKALPEGTEVVVTWSGGNGPWPYRVMVHRVFPLPRGRMLVYTPIRHWSHNL